jgi:hypothetical protein
MALPSEQSSVSYVGNNSTSVPYPIPFKFFTAADLVVISTDMAGEDTTLTPGTGYTVTGGDAETGDTGSFVTTAAIDSVHTVRVERTVSLTQETTFTGIGQFPSSAVDHSLDKLTMVAQQLQRQISAQAFPAFIYGGAAPLPVPNPGVSRLQLRSDTLLNWNAQNPILLSGEVGVEISTSISIPHRIKIGDGSTAWNLLHYTNDLASAAEAIAGADIAKLITPSTLKEAIDQASFVAGSYLISSQVAAVAGTENTTVMSPLRVRQSADAYIGATTQAALTAMDTKVNLAVGSIDASNRFAVDDALPGDGTAMHYGYYPQNGSPSLSSNAGTIFYEHPVMVRSTLKNVFFQSGGAGTAEIQVRRRNGRTIHVVSRSSAVTIASGANTLTASDFGTIILNPGDFVSIYSTQRYSSYATDASVLQVFIKLGDTATDTMDSDYVVAGLSVGFAWDAVPLAPRNSGVVCGAKTQLCKETYGNSAPFSWAFVTSTGSWTFNEGMLTPMGAGDMTQRATLGQYVCGEQITLEWVIQPQSTSSIIAFGIENNCLGLVDWSANTVSLRNGGANTSTLPGLFASAAIPSGISGRNYKVRYTRDRRVNTFTITDLQTLASVAVTENKDNFTGINYAMATGAFNGFPMVANRAQTTKILSFSAFWDTNRPYAWIVGDSITDGYNVTIPSRWSQMVKDLVGGSCMIFGVGGASSPLATQAFLGSMMPIRPKVLIFAMGTNDTDANLAQYKFHFWINKRWCEIYGVIFAPVVLGSTPAKTFTDMNAFILAQAALSSNIRPIRWDYALTLNNDGTTYVSGNYMDQIHPTQAVQSLLVAPVFAAVPELLQ